MYRVWLLCMLKCVLCSMYFMLFLVVLNLLEDSLNFLCVYWFFSVYSLLLRLNIMIGVLVILLNMFFILLGSSLLLVYMKV